MSVKRAILFQAIVGGYTLTAGMYLLADQHLSWRNAACGLADLAVSGLNIWLAARTFDRFFEEMARSFAELTVKLVDQEPPP